MKSGLRQMEYTRLGKAALFLFLCVLPVASVSVAALYVRQQRDEKASFAGTVSPVSESAAPPAAKPDSPSASAAVRSTASRSAASAASSGSLLMLVNKTHPLPTGYAPTLASVDIRYYYSSDKDNRMDARAAPYLEQMVADSRKAGANLVIVSGYRSHEYQQENFQRSVSRLMAQGQTASQASAATADSIAPPGTSEHETGLAVDVCGTGWFISNTDLNAGFDKTPAFKWLSGHAASYGFILRYPKDKVSVTGYTYEPWHYRFVGRDNAQKIKKSGLCLEEYLKKTGFS